MEKVEKLFNLFHVTEGDNLRITMDNSFEGRGRIPKFHKSVKKREQRMITGRREQRLGLHFGSLKYAQ